MHILIVDDHQTNLKLLGATLGAEGFTISQASDGLEALEILAKEHIDAVISDALMPNMDGYSLCAEVRRHPRCADLPFIVYTSTYTDRADEKLALQVGADHFLRKPASAKEIVKIVEALVAQRGRLQRTGAPARELVVMKQYSQSLIRKLEARNERLLAQTAALQASESHLRAVFEAEPDCVLVFGRDGRVASINPAGLALFEVDSVAELTACPSLHFVVEGDRPVFQECVENVWNGHNAVAEFQIDGARGSRRWLEMSAAPLRDAKGEIIAVLGISRDNTTRKQLEAQFVQAQKMEVVGQLASGIAHDFNNMISVIMGYSELVMRDLSSGTPLYDQVVTIFHTAERAAALTRQLLIFSRNETVDARVLDLGEAITGIQSMLRRLIGENITLVLEPVVELGGVEADLGQIEQVLMNLTVNARDAMPNGGTITLTTSRATLIEGEQTDVAVPAGDYVVLSIADNGCGMTPEVRAKIFEAFYTTKPAGKGTGLGLATCERIVARWKGYITVDSRPGVGTEFSIYFPRISERVSPSHVTGPQGVLPRGTETILVVEDEPGLLELATTILRNQGYNVLKASNGREALEIVQSQRETLIALVVTDMVMPEMGGRMMAEWLRATNPEIKMLFTSGYTDCGSDGELERAIEFLPKPYTPSALLRKTRQVIDRVPVATATLTLA